MNRYPTKDRYSRTGSSLRGSPVLDQRKAELARAAKPHDRLAKEQSRLERSLFTKAELRRAVEIGRQVNRDFREASTKAGGDALRIETLKLAARKKFERLLARELPQYRQWKAMRRAHMGAHAKLTQQAHAALPGLNASIDWDVVLELDATAQEFVPPFTTFDVQIIDFGGFVVSEESFARPNIGHMINNFAYDQDESTSIGRGILGILPIESAVSLVSCGVAFTTPSAGRLKINAEMLNIFNRINFSVSDNFGFSSAEVGVAVALFALVLRGNQDVERVDQVLITGSIDSGGSNQHRNISDLDTTAPHMLSVETATRLNANESVLVLAGSEVVIGTVLDDMHAKMDALLWWQLKRLVIDMAIDVIT